MILFFLVAGWWASAAGQSDSLESKVLRLLEVSGAENQFVSSAMNMIAMQESQPAFAQIPAAWWEKFKDRVRNEGWDSIAPSLADIYLQNYTEAEIDYLIAYHSHPLTQAIMAKLPVIQQQSMEVGQAWGERIARELQDQLTTDPEGN